jgi:hypothetical protein
MISLVVQYKLRRLEDEHTIQVEELKIENKHKSRKLEILERKLEETNQVLQALKKQIQELCNILLVDISSILDEKDNTKNKITQIALEVEKAIQLSEFQEFTKRETEEYCQFQAARLKEREEKQKERAKMELEIENEILRLQADAKYRPASWVIKRNFLATTRNVSPTSATVESGDSMASMTTPPLGMKDGAESVFIELLETERSYVRDLALIMEVCHVISRSCEKAAITMLTLVTKLFLEPLQTRKEEFGMNTETIDAIFCNLRSLHEINSEILAALEAQRKLPSSQRDIGSIFLDKVCVEAMFHFW